ncbi:MAG TPA: ParA family protein [Clostridia bacterium]|nr:ParA family protein [Clostridia bacterium]
MFKRINIICGHYGSGKTNLALNLALGMQSKGERVSLVDLDIVNPYFRSADYTRLMESHGIKVISPSTAGTTIDAPGLTASIQSVFDSDDSRVLIDVGGDDAGAFALGRFSQQIVKSGDYQMLYVVNKFRKLTSTPQEAVDLLREIESAAGLRATGIVNNSHLAHLTTAKDIIESQPYAEKISQLTALPLLMTTAPQSLADELTGRVENLYPVKIIVKLPWN